VSGTTVYLGGSFSTANGGTTRNKAAAVDTINGTLTSWNPNMGSTVHAVAVSGTTVYLGGNFTTANGVVQEGFAYYDVPVPSLTLSVDAASQNLGLLTAGGDASASSVVTVTTDAPTGYTLSAADQDNAWALTDGGTNWINDWTGTVGSPTAWAPGTNGCGALPSSCFGLTLLSTTGAITKPPAWGTGTLPTHYATNNYAGLSATAQPIASRNTFSAGPDTITTAYRTNLGATQAPGAYAATITYTAIINP
jgi:hypothetical protein